MDEAISHTTQRESKDASSPHSTGMDSFPVNIALILALIFYSRVKSMGNRNRARGLQPTHFASQNNWANYSLLQNFMPYFTNEMLALPPNNLKCEFRHFEEKQGSF